MPGAKRHFLPGQVWHHETFLLTVYSPITGTVHRVRLA